MGDMNTEEKIRDLLEKFKPSQLDEQLLITCPFYEPENKNFASIYKLIHDIAKSRLFTKLQLKLSKIAIASEVPLKFGYVNGIIGKICITNENNNSILIEVKTGRTKLVQPAIYTLLSGMRTLIVDLKTGDIIEIDRQTAERIVRELIEHLKDKEKLKELGKRIPGMECWHCKADCKYRKRKNRKPERKSINNILKVLQPALENIDNVADRITAEVLKRIGDIQNGL